MVARVKRKENREFEISKKGRRVEKQASARNRQPRTLLP